MDTATYPRRREEPARLIIVDDHQLVREGLQRILAGEPDLAVVGEAPSVREALALCARLRPDLVLMDVRMADMDGLAATRALRSERPDTGFIIVTIYDDPDYLLKALNAGAAGYLLKDSTKAQVLGAVRQVLRGAYLLNPDVMTQLVQRLVSQGAAPTAGATAEQLTARERAVPRLPAEGLTNREIARRLRVSLGTVKVHVGHIIAKLGVDEPTSQDRGPRCGRVAQCVEWDCAAATGGTARTPARHLGRTTRPATASVRTTRSRRLLCGTGGSCPWQVNGAGRGACCHVRAGPRTMMFMDWLDLRDFGLDRHRALLTAAVRGWQSRRRRQEATMNGHNGDGTAMEASRAGMSQSQVANVSISDDEEWQQFDFLRWLYRQGRLTE